MEIDRIDHLVLTVSDVDETCRFYVEALGMRETTFGGGRRALEFGEQKINLHQTGNEFVPGALKPVPGSADVCFITRRSSEEVLDHFRSRGVEVVQGPVEKVGALGPMSSVYVRDPDGNLVEVSTYGEGPGEASG